MRSGRSPTRAVTLVRLFLPFAFGYFLSYLYRSVNAVIAPDLMADLGLTSADLGLLTATYLLAFASFQLPLGVLLDRYGSRRVEGALLVVAAVGAYVFSRAGGVGGLLVGRALIGLGVSACLMAAFKAFVVWLPPERLPLANGIQMASGGLGALAATAPVEAALRVMDWRGVFVALAGATLAVAVAVRWIVPERAGPAAASPLGEQVRGVADVFRHRAFWTVAPWSVASQAVFLALQGLWAGPWLRQVGGLDRMSAAAVLFWMATAMVAGFLLLGTLAERLGGRGVRTMTVAAWGMAAFLAVQGWIVIGPGASPGLPWVLFGFFGTAGILTYASLTQGFPAHLAGRVNTALNLLVFIAAFAVQWGVGAVLDRVTPRLGAPGAYRVAFGLLLGLEVAGALWFFWRDRERGAR